MIFIGSSELLKCFGLTLNDNNDQQMLPKIVMANIIKVFEFTAAVPGYLHYRKF